LNILVVEDNSSHSKLASVVLTCAGYMVNEAVTPRAAIDAINAGKPQLILMDLELPDMDGLTLVRQLKADPWTADIRIVAVTSYPERFPRTEALNAGCAAYIVKPINTRALPGQLEDLMK
jgi:CheY-like chemotaxis protein